MRGKLEGKNLTSEENFLILGFSDVPLLQLPFFIAFLQIYLLIVVGNLLIMITIYSSTRLHTPMYFFLTNLSFIEISYSSAIFPQMLACLFLEVSHMSLTKCLWQIYIFLAMIAAEVVFLMVMSIDRYVAICNPLRYMTIMNKNMCTLMATGCWLVGILEALPHTVMMSSFSYCDSHRINHFYCGMSALMKISCTSTRVLEMYTLSMAAFVTLPSFVVIITSYINIITSILKMSSMASRHKAFSTCFSHLTVVLLFYSSLCGAYLQPTSMISIKDNKITSLAYIAVTPLCNPIIYTLKNNEFKNALKRKMNAM